MGKEKVIMLESLLERGIQTKDNFEMSFLSDIYTQVLTMVNSICKANSSSINRKTDYLTPRKYNEIQNVIAFTGRRGTGKSSAMLTLTNHICRKETIKCIGSVDASSLRQYGFNHLTYFSAATIDENEDVFQIVLTMLFDKLVDLSVKFRFDDKKQIQIDKLKEKICKIYDRYVSLKGSESLNIQSSYNLMDRLSQKYNVREYFKELIKEYSDFLTEISQNKYNSSYIVICIDDIDMAPNPMSIMQCIHQYLMINNLIVLISYNHKFLSKSLAKYFFEVVNCNAIHTRLDYSLSKEQSENFQEKIIPSDMIVTMPSWKKKDYQALAPIMVSLESTNKESISKFFPRLENSVLLEKFQKTSGLRLLPKHLIMLLVADRTKIFFDVFGNKFHFMEPDSLRTLYDMFYLLYSMDNIIVDEGKKNESDNHYYENRISNRKILLDFLNFRLRFKFNFSQEEEELIDRFLAEPIERRGEVIWNYYKNQLNRKNEELAQYKDGDNHFSIGLANNVYSFGDLYRILFYSSRLEIMSRNLIKFILATFSCTLPTFVENEKWKNDKRNPEYKNGNGYRDMRELFEYSLLGKWRDDLFESSTEHTSTSFSDQLVKSEPCIALYIDGIISDLSKDLLDSLFEDIVYHLLLSSRSTREPFEVKEDVYKEFYTIDNKIDPTAFIMNSIRMNERFKHLKFSIFKQLNNEEFRYSTTLYKNITKDQPPFLYSISYLLTDLFFNSVEKSDDIENAKEKLKSVVSDLHNGLNGNNSEDENGYKKKVEQFKEKIEKYLKSNEYLSLSDLAQIISEIFECDGFNTQIFNSILHESKIQKKHTDDVILIIKTLVILNYYFSLSKDKISKKMSSKEGSNSKCDVSFMLKHTDLSYNVIKRSVSKMIYVSSNNIMEKRKTQGGDYEIIKAFYQNVVGCLDKEDDVFFIDGKDNPESFSQHFLKHPVVDYFIRFEDARSDKDNRDKKSKCCRIERISNTKNDPVIVVPLMENSRDDSKKHDSAAISTYSDIISLADIIALIKQSDNDSDNMLNPVLTYLQVKLSDYMRYSLTHEQADFIIDKIYEVSYDEKVIEDIYNKDIFESCVNDIRNMLRNDYEEDN